MKIIIIIAFSILYAVGIYSQDSCLYPILLYDIAHAVQPENTTSKYIEEEMNDGNTIKINLKSCMGDLDFQVFDTLNNCIITGSFKRPPIISTAYSGTIYLLHTDNPIHGLRPYQFYRPVPDGKWTYWENGVIREEVYDIEVRLKQK